MQQTTNLTPASGETNLFRFAETSRQTGGFTLIELLVVLAVVALWALLLVPALARTQPDSRAFQCLNNSRQLTRAWRMYADDNNDKLATSVFGSQTMGPTLPQWALGWLDWGTSSDNTNTVFLTDPRYSILANYCGKEARLFKCPADQFLSATQRAFRWKERVRSVAQDYFADNGNADSFPIDPSYVQVTKFAGLRNPKPDATWVSMDEHPDSINDGVLFPPSSSQWIDLPANYHDGGAGVAFADGRSEIHRWQASLLRVPLQFAYSAPAVTPNDLDLLWVRNHTPRQP